jgi:hypothetical protein
MMLKSDRVREGFFLSSFSTLAALAALAMAFVLAAPAQAAVSAAPDSTNGWGYGYDSLLKDLGLWRASPFVRIDSIGASVEGRAQWMVTITGPGDSLGAGDSSKRKHRVFIHARTHPAEVQANYISNEAIRFLTDPGDSMAAQLREGFIFNIVPMYNPDGVQDGHSRLNAHLVDLESNWDKTVIEPEVANLHKVFQSYMAGPIPIEVALNLHSDQFNCTRFFFFHYAAGTSEAYTVLEKSLISMSQAHFPGGIKNWDFVASWGDGTQARYPEGFWWLNYKESVMALTYEDTNCPNAGRFDSTGRALVMGSADYIRSRMSAGVRPLARQETRMLLLGGGVRIRSAAAPGREQWLLSDMLGRRLAGGNLAPGENFLAWNTLGGASAGILSIIGPAGPPGRLMIPGMSR